MRSPPTLPMLIALSAGGWALAMLALIYVGPALLDAATWVVLVWMEILA